MYITIQLTRFQLIGERRDIRRHRSSRPEVVEDWKNYVLDFVDSSRNKATKRETERRDAGRRIDGDSCNKSPDEGARI